MLCLPLTGLVVMSYMPCRRRIGNAPIQRGCWGLRHWDSCGCDSPDAACPADPVNRESRAISGWWLLTPGERDSLVPGGDLLQPCQNVGIDTFNTDTSSIVVSSREAEGFSPRSRYRHAPARIDDGASTGCLGSNVFIVYQSDDRAEHPQICADSRREGIGRPSAALLTGSAAPQPAATWRTAPIFVCMACRCLHVGVELGLGRNTRIRHRGLSLPCMSDVCGLGWADGCTKYEVRSRGGRFVRRTG